MYFGNPTLLVLKLQTYKVIYVVHCVVLVLIFIVVVSLHTLSLSVTSTVYEMCFRICDKGCWYISSL